MRLIDLMNSPWAIAPEKLREIHGIYATHLRGEKIDLKGIEARIGQPLNNKSHEIEVRDGVAIIQVEGVLSHKMNLLTEISGGTSTQIIGSQVKQALSDNSIKAIILEVDSQGGSVLGLSELSDLIFNARSEKPIVALASEYMASAAYFIGSAAGEVLISAETAIVGSIGVVQTHTDISKSEEMNGIKTTEITAGKYKRIASEHEPLTDEGRADLQAFIDSYYSIFVKHVARNRGASIETVLADMADGRTFVGKQAIQSGLADGVSTLDALVKRLSQSGGDSVPDNNILNSNEGIETMEPKTTPLTADTIAKDHPSVYAEIIAGEKEKHHAEGRAEGLDIGAEQERLRIKSVEAQGENMPGYKKLIAELKFDGKTTGPEAAAKILEAEKTKRGVNLKDIEEDSPDAVAEPDTPTGEADLSKLPVEERCKAEWGTKPELHDEFSTLEAYTACEQSMKNGQARIKNN